MKLGVPPCPSLTVYTPGVLRQDMKEEKKQSRVSTSAGHSLRPFPTLAHLITPTTLGGSISSLPADEETEVLQVQYRSMKLVSS